MSATPTQAELNNPVSHLTGQCERAEELNDPREWFRTLNPPLFNRRRFQRRIDEITGLTQRRQSKILLRWAWESSYEMFGRLRMRYNFLTIPVKGVPTDFSIPRWVVEERIEPEQIRDSWDATRYVLDPGTVVNDVDPETGKVRKVVYEGDKVDKGECPQEWFRNLWVVAEHDRLCCGRADRMGRNCWGYYRHPDGRDIQRVERIHAAKARDDAFTQSPFEVLSPETLEGTGKSFFVRHDEDLKGRQEAEIKGRVHDFFNTHLYGLSFETPRYSFGSDVKPYRKTDGGLIIPD